MKVNSVTLYRPDDVECVEPYGIDIQDLGEGYLVFNLYDESRSAPLESFELSIDPGNSLTLRLEGAGSVTRHAVNDAIETLIATIGNHLDSHMGDLDQLERELRAYYKHTFQELRAGPEQRIGQGYAPTRTEWHASRIMAAFIAKPENYIDIPALASLAVKAARNLINELDGRTNPHAPSNPDFEIQP